MATSWFDKLTPRQQKAYLKEHPSSKYSKLAKRIAKRGPPSKSTIARRKKMARAGAAATLARKNAPSPGIAKPVMSKAEKIAKLQAIQLQLLQSQKLVLETRRALLPLRTALSKLGQR